LAKLLEENNFGKYIGEVKTWTFNLFQLEI
jgi:hypothetical protein